MKQSNQQIFLRALGVSFFLVLLWSSLALSAQQSSYSVTFTTAKQVGEQIEFGYIAKDVNQINIDGVKEQPSKSNSGSVKYTLASQKITIRGELSHLFVSDAMLTQLDVTQMPSLVNLNCSKNELTTLDISRCVKLNSILCFSNNITQIKGLSSATQLKRLICNENALSTLDLPKSTALEFIDCAQNNLPTLDLSKAPNLKTLVCSKNQIATLDLSQTPDLVALSCGDNVLQGLDLSGVKNLSYLECPRNQIKGISMTHLISTLPTPTQEGQLILVSSRKANQDNEATKVDVANARSRNWKVLNDNQEEYEGVAETFAVTLFVGEGGTAKIEGAKDLTKVEEGSQLMVVATPQTGYELDKIMAGDEDITTSKQFVVKGATEVKVTFKKSAVIPEPKKTFAVTLVVGDGGTAKVEGAKDLTKVEEGSQLTVVATPQTGYELDKIMAGNEDITTSKQFVVKGATEVKVTFKKSTAVTDVASAQLQIYPNPTAQELHIAGVAPHLLLTLYNVEGEAVAVAMADTQGIAEMDLSHLPAGLYLLQISGELHRIVVQRH